MTHTVGLHAAVKHVFKLSKDLLQAAKGCFV
ncbi:hypothetical protein [Bacillus sp. ISL-77]